MNETEQAYWRKFLETGQVTDYLRYRKHMAEQRENPRRRIEETSRNKKFYCRIFYEVGYGNRIAERHCHRRTDK
ncbi:MAG: hypothetical protein IIU70_06820, partial [Anaerotignum sp.]|nr:hypothetical protein [Anaerotignum sp.]